METLADYVQSAEEREPVARPLVLVAAAALSVVNGQALGLLRFGADGVWHLPRRAPGSSETLEDAARRELKLSGMSEPLHVEQLYTRGEPDSEPERLVEIAYLALSAAPIAASSAPGCRWWPITQLPAMVRGHAELLRGAVQRLRRILWHTNAAWALLPDEFTLSELQAVYEAAEGRSLDKRNFRKWVLANNLVEATPRERRDGAHRPARLYRFTRKELVNLD